MQKYRFTVILERELTHEEFNKLEIAFCDFCDQYGYSFAELVQVENKNELVQNPSPDKDGA